MPKKIKRRKATSAKQPTVEETKFTSWGGFMIIFIAVLIVGSGLGYYLGEHVIPKGPHLTIGKEKAETYSINVGLQAVKLSEETNSKESILSTLEKSLIGYASVSYIENKDSFEMKPTDPSFLPKVAAMIDEEIEQTDWNTLIEQTSRISKQISALTADENVTLSIVNPDNPNKFLLTAVNGEVLYDVLNE